MSHIWVIEVKEYGEWWPLHEHYPTRIAARHRASLERVPTRGVKYIKYVNGAA